MWYHERSANKGRLKVLWGLRRQLQKLQECLKSYENQGRYDEDDVNLFYSQGFGDHTPPPIFEC